MENDYQPEKLDVEIVEDIFQFQTIYSPRILNYYQIKKGNATKHHMFCSIMFLTKKSNLRNMPTICFLCIIHYSVAILPHMPVNFQNRG